VIFDAEMLYAFFVADSKRHWAIAGETELAVGSEDLIVSPFVVAELERIVRERLGLAAWLAVLEQLASGAWAIVAVDTEHLTSVRERAATGDRWPRHPSR